MNLSIDSALSLETEQMLGVVAPYVGRANVRSSTGVRRLVSLFGFDLEGLAVLWLLTTTRFAADLVGACREQMLWALHWLRVYGTESQSVALFRSQPGEKKFRESNVVFVNLFANLGLVRC